MNNTYYIRVVVDPSGAKRGAREVGGALDDINTKAAKTQSLFKTMFEINLALRAGQYLMGLADAYTTVSNKIRIVTGDGIAHTLAMEKAFEVAKRSRSSVEDIASSYQRISESTKDLGLSQTEVWRVTETLAKSLRVSGATSAEAASTMTQFSQALTKGKLNGDEMRSIMENNIVVQRALAAQLGVSRDALLDMSKAGEITSEVMVKALLSASAEVDAQFKSTQATIGDAFTQFRNELIQLVGELNKSADMGKVFTQFLAYVVDQARMAAESVGLIISAVKKLDSTLGGLPGKLLGGTLPGGIKKSRISDLIVPGIDQLGAYKEIYDEGFLRYLRGEKEGRQDGLAQELLVASLGKSPEEIGADMRKALETAMGRETFSGIDVGGFLDEVSVGIADGWEDVAEAVDLMGKAYKKGADEFNKLKKEYNSLVDGLFPVIKAQRELRDAEILLDRAQKAGLVTKQRAAEILERQRTALKDQIDPVRAHEMAIKLETAALERQARVTNQFDSDVEERARAKVVEQQKAGILNTQAQVDAARATYEWEYKRLAIAERIAAAVATEKQERASLFDRLGIESVDNQYYRRLAEIEQAHAKAIHTAEEAFKRNPDDIAGRELATWAADRKRDEDRLAAGTADYLPRASSDLDEYVRNVQRLREEYPRTAEGNYEFSKAVRQLNGDLVESDVKAKELTSTFDGMREGMRSVYADLNNMAETVAQSIQNLAANLQEAVVTMVRTSEFEFDKLVTSILDDLARLATQKMFQELLGLAIGSLGPTSWYTEHSYGNDEFGAVKLLDPFKTSTKAATGGLFKVAGPAGRDRVPVQMMLTAGEHLQVTPQGRAPAGGGAVPPVNVILVKDEREASLAVMQSPAGRRTQVRNLSINDALLRALQAQQ